MLTSLQQKFRVYGVDLRRNHKGMLKWISHVTSDFRIILGRSRILDRFYFGQDSRLQNTGPTDRTNKC